MANGRCRMHGGKSTGAPENTNAVTHGFYSSALMDDEEKALYAAAKIGDLEDEIRIAKVKLYRFIKRASSKYDLALEIEKALAEIEISRPSGESPAIDKRMIRILAPDYSDFIIRQLDVIRKLEVSRFTMMNSVPAGEDDDLERTDVFISPDAPGPKKPIL